MAGPGGRIFTSPSQISSLCMLLQYTYLGRRQNNSRKWNKMPSNGFFCACMVQRETSPFSGVDILAWANHHWVSVLGWVEESAQRGRPSQIELLEFLNCLVSEPDKLQ